MSDVSLGFFRLVRPEPLEHTCTEIRREELKSISSWDKGEPMEHLTPRWQLWMCNDPLACLGFPRVLLHWKTVQTEFLFHESEFSHKIADLCLAAVLSSDHMVITRGCDVRRMLLENPRHPSALNPRFSPEGSGLRKIPMATGAWTLGIGLLEKRWSLVAERWKEAHADACSEAWQTETYLWIWCFNTQAATSDQSHKTKLTFPVES